jgi:hypothetical protein
MDLILNFNSSKNLDFPDFEVGFQTVNPRCANFPFSKDKPDFTDRQCRQLVQKPVNLPFYQEDKKRYPCESADRSEDISVFLMVELIGLEPTTSTPPV